MRIALILVGLLPLLTAIVVLAVYNARAERQVRLAETSQRLTAATRYIQFMLESRAKEAARMAAIPAIRNAVARLESGRDIGLSGLTGLTADFAEVVDSNAVVRLSAFRPGMVGRTLPLEGQSGAHFAAVRDRRGLHAAIRTVIPAGTGHRLVAGWYLDSTVFSALADATGADIRAVFAGEDDEEPFAFETGQLYEADSALQAVLAGGQSAGFVLTAAFPLEGNVGDGVSLTLVAALVSAIALIGALAAGLYLTAKAKREIDNLVTASERIAAGDFDTPVMAYEEGEFSILADALADMTVRLKTLRRELAATEKIAAWEAVGRTVAHEVKNPLTPIAISADDLRRSYREKLPEFETTLYETTAMIKSEVDRLTRLLDEFSKFAHLPRPDIQPIRVAELADRVQKLYSASTARERVRFEGNAPDVSLSFDPDLMQQVLVNLIKNGLESAPDAVVTVTTQLNDKEVLFTVTDTGPGFPPEVLQGEVGPRASTKEGGLGLGLAVCQRIVMDHNATLELDNGETGAQVTVKLPRKHG
jgi:signal transduction histidine kinase